MIAFRTVLFDCDSTLTRLEGIDRLARGHEDLAALTDAAMKGDVRLEDVYRRRLDIARPDRDQLRALADAYLDHVVDDAAEVIAALSRAGAQVHVISGGLRQAVEPFARALGVAPERVHAVDVRFDDAGRYVGFDDASPLARSGGKSERIESLAASLLRPILLVGDGMTDLEAAPAVDLFVAYAGVVDRAAVSAVAPVAIHGRSLAPVLALAVPDPNDVAPEDRALHGRAVALFEKHVTDRRKVEA